jgi:DNA-binding winged helix-turn-helix (wHTH) protein
VDNFVQEANLSQMIFLLRKALKGQDYIATVPRRGYRFAARATCHFAHRSIRVMPLMHISELARLRTDEQSGQSEWQLAAMHHQHDG